MAKVYSEKEASEILQKAVALQEAAGEAGEAYTPGITIEELRKIAEEAGLDPKFLDLAMTASTQPEPPKKWFLNLVQDHERVIEGELPPDHFDIVLDGVGRAHRKAALRQVGRAVEGQIGKGWGFGWLKLTSRRGRTRLSLRSNCFVPFMTTIYPALIVGAILGSNLAEQGMGLAGFGTFLGLLMAGFGVFQYGVKKSHEAFAKLADDLEARIEDENEALRNELSRPVQERQKEEESIENRLR